MVLSGSGLPTIDEEGQGTEADKPVSVKRKKPSDVKRARKKKSKKKAGVKRNEGGQSVGHDISANNSAAARRTRIDSDTDEALDSSGTTSKANNTANASDTVFRLSTGELPLASDLIGAGQRVLLSLNQLSLQEDADKSPQPSSSALLPKNQKPFKFDDMTKLLICNKKGCGRMTNCWDGTTVICPACGPYSLTRYCCAQHLYDDLAFHWAQDCGSEVSIPVDEYTIRPRQINLRPFIKSPHWDSVERYRQAIYHSANKTGDYFIFFDADEILGGLGGSTTSEEFMASRGCGRLGVTLVFPDDDTRDSVRGLFNMVLEDCLGDGVARPDRVEILVMMIRENLCATNQWTSEMVTYLCMQIGFEFNYKIPEVHKAPFYDYVSG